MSLREKDRITALFSAAKADGWILSFSRQGAQKTATRKSADWNNPWVLLEGNDSDITALGIVLSKDVQCAYLSKGNTIFKSKIVNNGSPMGFPMDYYYQYQTPTFLKMILSRMSRLFHVFDSVPETFTPDDYRKTEVFDIVPLYCIPADMKLVAELSCVAPEELKGIPRMIGGTGPASTEQLLRKTLKFTAEFKRSPINVIEAEKGRPLTVKLARFGVELPFNIRVPAENGSSRWFYVNEDGITTEKGETRVPFGLHFDTESQTFYEARFKSWLFSERPDGMQRIVDRLTSQRSVNQVATDLEAIVGFPLSRMGFKAFAETFNKTFGYTVSIPYTSYDPETGVFHLGTSSNMRGIPTKLSQDQLNAYIVTLSKFQTILQATRFQESFHSIGENNAKKYVERDER